MSDGFTLFWIKPSVVAVGGVGLGDLSPFLSRSVASLSSSTRPQRVSLHSGLLLPILAQMAPVPAHPPSSACFGSRPKLPQGSLLGSSTPGGLRCCAFSQHPLLCPCALIVITSVIIGSFLCLRWTRASVMRSPHVGVLCLCLPCLVAMWWIFFNE